MRSPIALILALLLPAAAIAQQPRSTRIVAPAVYRSGPMPALPALALGGGEVFLELTVSERGSVTAVRPIRVTVPYTDLVILAVRSWQFIPAEELVDPAARKPGEPATRPVPSKVVVAALFRPPAIHGPTLGEPAHDVASPSDDVPFPVVTPAPDLVPVAWSYGVVLTEARLDAAGAVSQVDVKRSMPPFDDAALQAARQWRFRPARDARTITSSRVYVMFGFRAPDAVGTRSGL